MSEDSTASHHEISGGSARHRRGVGPEDRGIETTQARAGAEDSAPAGEVPEAT